MGHKAMLFPLAIAPVLAVVLALISVETLGANYSGHLSAKQGQRLVQTDPYRVTRHPAYAGLLLMALGLALGYSSLVGIAALLFALLPSMIYRIRVEE